LEESATTDRIEEASGVAGKLAADEDIVDCEIGIDLARRAEKPSARWTGRSGARESGAPERRAVRYEYERLVVPRQVHEVAMAVVGSAAATENGDARPTALLYDLTEPLLAGDELHARNREAPAQTVPSMPHRRGASF
jgi:hypothetical protein